MLVLILMAGCATPIPRATTTPIQTYRLYTVSYNKIWGVVITALQGEDINMNVVDKDSGLINGEKNLTPSTMDMLTNYAVRTLVNVNIQRVENNKIKVSIRSRGQRNYKNRGWRPSAVSADSYSDSLLNKIEAML